MVPDLLFATGFVPLSEAKAKQTRAGMPWGWPNLYDASCWNTEMLMAGAVPVSCTGLRYSHSSTLAGSLAVDKWTRRSCNGRHEPQATVRGGAEPPQVDSSSNDGNSEVGSSNEDGTNDINEVEVEMTVGKPAADTQAAS